MEHSVIHSFSAECPELRVEHVKHLLTEVIALHFRDFVKSAWADIERFKEQKNHDLKEALISYAVMQISMCKKVRVAWEGLAQGVCPVSRGADADCH